MKKNVKTTLKTGSKFPMKVTRGSSPDKLFISAVATGVFRSKAIAGAYASAYTTGVKVHSRFRGRLLESWRSPQGRSGKVQFTARGITAKQGILPPERSQMGP